jgi:hypothetical protein
MTFFTVRSVFTAKDTKSAKGAENEALDPVHFQLTSQALFVRGLEQARAQLPADLKGTAKDPVRQLVKRHFSCPSW